MFSAPFFVTLLDRVKAIVRRVARPAAEQTRRMPVDSTSAPAPISPEMGSAANGWLRTKLRALSALMRRIEAGESLERPARLPVARRRGDLPVIRDAVPPEERLPRGFGWMCAVGPDVRGDGAAFVEWLSEPHMQAKMQAAPERMAHVIGPILNATGAQKPTWFPVLSKRVKAGRHVGCDSTGDGLEFADSRGAAEVADTTAPASHTIRCRDRSALGGRCCLVATVHRTAAFACLFGVTADGISKMRRMDTRCSRAHFVTITKR
jgi:hypothetical protein